MKNINNGDERRIKNETWTKGGGGVGSRKSEIFNRDNNRVQKQQLQRAK